MNLPATGGPVIEQAGPSDADVLSQVIAAAFEPLPPSVWLVPDLDTRLEIFPAYFGLHVEHALADGLVLTTADRDAAALWLPVGPDGPGQPPGRYRERLAGITGPHAQRFTALDQAFDARHPAGVPHQYLAILAVHPARQRTGIGSALLRFAHDGYDREGVPAYLEASDTGKREIYLKHGYRDHGDPITLPGGPELYPMWRSPRLPARPGGMRLRAGLLID
jgi:GNAT superfamily N-acetyltransferase